MKRIGFVALAAVAVLMLVLLTVDVHAAYTTDNTNSSQTVASAKAGGGTPLGNKLLVYLAGEKALAGPLKAQLAGALRAKELLFDEVIFVDELPADAHEYPVLTIYSVDAGGFWTPAYATTHLKATLLFAMGGPINPDHVLTIDPAGFSAAFGNGTCVGACSEGHRVVDLTARTVGLVSLPHMRSFVAGKLVEEAVALVAGGLPEHLNPAKWGDRAGELAREKLPTQGGGFFSSFRRMAGCRGGIVAVGEVAEGGDWSFMYYSAERDAITEVVTRSDVEARSPGVARMGMPGVGSGDDGRSLYLGGTYFTFPDGTCGLSGWQIASDAAR